MSRIANQSVFQHPAWFLAYFKSLDSDDSRIKFFCIYRGRVLVAVFPIVFEKRGLIKCAQLPRTMALFNSDCAVSDGEDKAEIWGYVCHEMNGQESTRWDAFLVRGDGALENSCIAQCMPVGSGTTIRKEKKSCCDVIETRDYEASLAALKGDFRRDLNRRKRKLSQERAVEYFCVEAPSERAAMQKAFDMFVELEQSGWKGKTGARKAGYEAPSAIGLFEWKYAFYKNVVSEFAKLGATEIFIIKADEKPIVAQICVVLNETSFMLKTAYDESSKRYAPGHLGIDQMVKKYASTEEVSQLNMITDYSWHSSWKPQKVKYLHITQFNKSIIGLVLQLAYGIKRLTAKVLKTGR